MELWHDVGVSCWEGGEEEIAPRGGAVGRATCCSDEDLERDLVYICTQGFGSEVVAAGAGVGYCGIL